MEFVEISDEGSYGMTVDGTWYLTPLGLAQWADEEGGWESLLKGKGMEHFIEAGVDPVILANYVAVHQMMENELGRIGAVL